MPIDEKMPLGTLAVSAVQEPVDVAHAYFGRCGGEFDETSGVLTLTYVPNDDWEEFEAEDDFEVYDTTTAHFVEIEKLLDALTKSGMPFSRDYWIEFLTEALDAVTLEA